MQVWHTTEWPAALPAIAQLRPMRSVVAALLLFAIARGLAVNRSLTAVDLSFNGLGAASQAASAAHPNGSLSLAVRRRLCTVLLRRCGLLARAG